METRGILLLGGNGTRLFPVTLSISKHLLTIYNKPLFYYSLSNLMLAGIRDISVVCRPQDLIAYEAIIGDGSQWGVRVDFIIQEEAIGIAHALQLVTESHHSESYMLVLGDNFLYGSGLGRNLNTYLVAEGAGCFGYEVNNPECFGVVRFGADSSVLEIVEKPEKFLSNWAIPGVYFFDNSLPKKLESITKSHRNEFEITEILNMYARQETLVVTKLSRGIAWLDLGSFTGIQSASNFVESIERTQNIMIGCLEEIAVEMGWVSKKIMLKNISNYSGEYITLVRSVIDRKSI